MPKMPAVIVVLVAAVCVLGFTSKSVERAYASPAAVTETVAPVSLPSNEAALQRLGEAVADDGTEALPGQVEPVLVASSHAAKPGGKPIQRR
jgi:hypothetical protein